MHRGLLAQRERARGQVVVHDGGRGHQGGIGEAQRRGVELGIDAPVDRIGGLGQVDPVTLAGHQVHHPHPGQSVFPLPHDQPIAESIDRIQSHAFGVRQDFPPMLAAGGRQRGLDHPEILRGVVGENEEPVAVRRDGVFDPLFPAKDHARSGGRLRSRQAANLGGRPARNLEQHPPASSTPAHFDEERLVLLRVYQLILRGISAEAVTVDRPGPPRLVDHYVEQRVVVGPCEASLPCPESAPTTGVRSRDHARKGCGLVTGKVHGQGVDSGDRD